MGNISQLEVRAAEADLAAEVYRVFYANTSSFELAHVGSGLAYLMGAILTGDKYLMGEEGYEFFDSAMDKLFPKQHRVWEFIVNKVGE